jgi:hypothetical protein
MGTIVMDKKLIAVLAVLLVLIPVFSGCLEEDKPVNYAPCVEIGHPGSNDKVSKIVTISGSASDSNGDQTIKYVEVLIGDEWFMADGTIKWSYSWETFDVENGFYNIFVRAWDGAVYSEEILLELEVDNPVISESDAHKWAIFIIASNFPKENESKLGNGGLYLAEEMVSYFVETLDYPTSNIVILFDDGWIRRDNGFGGRLSTLQERYHRYDITYEGATKNNVKKFIDNMVEEANQFKDSEVFIWIASHGVGDSDIPLTGGKLFQRSAVQLWDKPLYDNELGDYLSNLKSKKTCVIVDACFSGGFADKTIFGFSELFLFNSNIPKSGRVVITGASKFRVGYASTTLGSLFTRLWFYGIKSEKADGFRPGLFSRGRPTNLNIFKDGKISVEEAFYYASYTLLNDEEFEDFKKMNPQINDQYPGKGLLFSINGLVLG